MNDKSNWVIIATIVYTEATFIIDNNGKTCRVRRYRDQYRRETRYYDYKHLDNMTRYIKKYK